MLKKLDIAAEKVIIEINLEIIEKDKYSETKIKENDNVEIITFMGGG